MTLGELLPIGAVPGRRDAFHVPAILANGVGVQPGDSVRFTDMAMTNAERCPEFCRHGVVNPFSGVLPGRPFWVLLNPALIRDLTHHFDVKPDPPITENKPDEEAEIEAEFIRETGCGAGPHC